ncbi:MAG: hypothetical protein OHK0022_03970 [Roseiflexaceae bacterium]
MVTQPDFTPEEWVLLGDAPLAAATAVALAEEGGGRREAVALLDAWRDAEDLFVEYPLLRAIIHDLDPEARATAEPPEAAPPANPEDDILGEALDLCRAAVSLLAQKARPVDVQAYQRFVLHLADAVAHADNNGGLPGLGVSPDERRTLRAIRLALDYTPPELTLEG